MIPCSSLYYYLLIENYRYGDFFNDWSYISQIKKRAITHRVAVIEMQNVPIVTEFTLIDCVNNFLGVGLHTKHLKI